VGRYVNRLAQHNTHIAPGMTLITSNRHPTDINTTIREMFDHMFVFGLRGSSSRRTANDLADGLTDVVDDLERYQFAHVGSLGNVTRFRPVAEMKSYDRI